jgi:8-hydroxy-5-deazaflavin:NADPH oxidoreductase
MEERIGIIGSGRIGGTLAGLLEQVGHEVRVANTREAGSGPEVVRFGEVVVLALPWVARDALREYGPWDGKIVVDATNPYGAGGPVDLGDDTSSEAVAEAVPGARLVKAFNTMLWTRLGAEGKPDAPEDERLAMFVAGDDEPAKVAVASLIRELGFAPVDTGSLREGGRRQQPGSPIYNVPLTKAQAEAELRALS